MKKSLFIIAALCMCMLVSGCSMKSTGNEEIPVSADTTGEYALLQNIVKQVRMKTDFVPKAALVLGSGLGELGESIDKVAEISYSEINEMPVSTAPGHEGQFILGYLEDVPLIVMQGRVHCYEGYTSLEVVRPIRVMKMLGADTLILTNSSGAINTDFKGGEIMLITDHIVYGVQNPLIGANIEGLGERFPDMGNCYDEGLLNLAREAAAEVNVPLSEGVYLQDSGPSFETEAEVKMFRSFGADAVGMSTAIETIAARHMGMRVCGLSCVTCPPGDVLHEELSAESVNAAAEQMTENLEAIVMALLRRI